jgi:hypothetical protein
MGDCKEKKRDWIRAQRRGVDREQAGVQAGARHGGMGVGVGVGVADVADQGHATAPRETINTELARDRS